MIRIGTLENVQENKLGRLFEHSFHSNGNKDKMCCPLSSIFLLHWTKSGLNFKFIDSGTIMSSLMLTDEEKERYFFSDYFILH